MTTDFRALCAELADALDHNRQCLLDDRRLTHPLSDKARAALAESGSNNYTVASDDTMRRIRSTTKRWRVSAIISTNDGAIDTRIGCGIWKCLDIEREILESVSLPECLPLTKENDNDH